jgi:putative endonuclease
MELHAIGADRAHPTIEEAIAREKALKNWNRLWKCRLIAESNPNWDDLWDQINN